MRGLVRALTTLLNIHARRCFCFPQAFHNYKKVMLKGKETSRFARLMDPLIQSAYPTEALVRPFLARLFSNLLINTPYR